MSDSIAVMVGTEFTIIDDPDQLWDIELKPDGRTVHVGRADYPLMYGRTYEDSRRVDRLLDRTGGLKVKDYLTQPAHDAETTA